ncbi:MAG: hypothetical protein EXS10_08755, partial [Phycisphaerales bacterium]|nr:hypothetical protein [Phycisphaerales bacterium]
MRRRDVAISHVHASARHRARWSARELSRAATEGEVVTMVDAQGLPIGYSLRRDDETTPRELRAMLDNGDAVTIVDCRTQGEWDVCKLAGAQLIPLQDLERRMDELKASLDDNLATRIVVHCHHGR